MTNKNIVILGGTDGIGRALAQMLVRDNFVLIIGRSENKGRRFTEQNERNAKYLVADLSLLNNLSSVVHDIKSEFETIDYIIHTADVLKVKRHNTTEGLETCIATNYYSRVLFNQLIIGEEPSLRPERIIHIGLAGIKPSRNFIQNFPLPDSANSFKGHAIGQIANDFYALYINRKLKDLGIKINVLNPGTVDTNIRRSGQFPPIVKRLIIPLIEFLLRGKTQKPQDYADIPLAILKNGNSDSNEFVLIDSKGKGITGNNQVHDTNIQQELYEVTKKQIDKVLQSSKVDKWL